MIAFACVVAEAEPFDRFAGPGMSFAAEADSEMVVLASIHPAARSLNLALDAASSMPDLEALVIVDTYTELQDADFCAKVRRELQDPDVAILGVLGASNFRGTAWWEGDVRGSPVEHRYRELGGGTTVVYPWIPISSYIEVGEVDAVNEMVMVLSPWAVQHLRFDEQLHLRHGVEIDLCHQARAHGRKVLVAPFSVRYHGSLSLNADVMGIQIWQDAHVALSSKWTSDPTPENPNSENWKRRARASEAEKEATWAFSTSLGLALEEQRERLEDELRSYTSTRGWKLTSPLRRLNARRVDRGDGQH